MIRNGIYHIPFWMDPSVNPSADPKQLQELLDAQKRGAAERDSNPLTHQRGISGKLSRTYQSTYEVMSRERQRR